LSAKVANPNANLDAISLIGETSAREWAQRVAMEIGSVNVLIDQHNSYCDDFTAIQQRARDDLQGHYLAVDKEEYEELAQAVVVAGKRVSSLNDEAAVLGREIEALKKLVRKHGPAAIAFNKLLKTYLGRGEIELVPTEEAFEIHRGGQALKGALSEGEKTALALCYFLVSLEADGRKSRDLLVVVDDPISSLDTRALHYAFNMLKNSLHGASQLIISTHNIQFMNEVKKWLKNTLRNFEAKNPEGAPPAALLFIDTTQDLSNGVRSSSLIELPKLIRDYDSEYHYLFFLVVNFASSFATFSDYFYLMPNALRKVMDIFFAFKVPGPHGLASKVDTIANGKNVDPNVLRSIDRLVQLESHADSLDDLVSLSSLTLKETREAATSLLKFMEVVEPEHFKQMVRLCKQ
jgi:wobble nucleotide-excising tRNase